MVSQPDTAERFSPARWKSIALLALGGAWLAVVAWVFIKLPPNAYEAAAALLFGIAALYAGWIALFYGLTGLYSIKISGDLIEVRRLFRRALVNLADVTNAKLSKYALRLSTREETVTLPLILLNHAQILRLFRHLRSAGHAPILACAPLGPPWDLAAKPQRNGVLSLLIVGTVLAAFILAALGLASDGYSPGLIGFILFMSMLAIFDALLQIGPAILVCLGFGSCRFRKDTIHLRGVVGEKNLANHFAFRLQKRGSLALLFPYASYLDCPKALLSDFVRRNYPSRLSSE